MKLCFNPLVTITASILAYTTRAASLPGTTLGCFTVAQLGPNLIANLISNFDRVGSSWSSSWRPKLAQLCKSRLGPRFAKLAQLRFQLCTPNFIACTALIHACHALRVTVTAVPTTLLPSVIQHGKPKKNTTTPPRETRPKSKPEAPSREPNIEWTKNPDWTWSLVAYLTDRPVFRHKLFSDSTSSANKENRAKSVGKDGRQQMYATLAEHIFKEDEKESANYSKKPTRFATGVETRLRRLKKEYIGHLNQIGSTGAGLDPDQVVEGSNLANVIAQVTESWPWWKEFHSFWRELPNYNPIGVTSSTPGQDHAQSALALFDTPQNHEQADTGDEEDGECDAEGEEEVDYETAMDKTYRQSSRSPSPPPSTGPKSTVEKPTSGKSTVPPKAEKPALGGRDSGIKKGQAAAAASRSTNTTKSIIKELTEARGVESERMYRKREMAHELALENARNKRLKYEAKAEGARLEHEAKAEAARLEQAFRLEELKMRLEIAKLESQKAVSVSAVPRPAAIPFHSAAASSSSFDYVSDVPYEDSSSMGRSSSPMVFTDGSSGGQMLF